MRNTITHTLRVLGIGLRVLAIVLTVSAKVMGLIVIVVITIMAFLAHFVPRD